MKLANTYVYFWSPGDLFFMAMARTAYEPMKGIHTTPSFVKCSFVKGVTLFEGSMGIANSYASDDSKAATHE